MNTIPRKYTITFEIENLKILITLASDFFYEQKSFSNLHSHNSFEFHVLSDGVSIVSSNAGNMRLTPFQACIIPANTFHRWIPKSKTTITSFCFSYEKNKKRTVKDVFATFDHAFGQVKDIKKIEHAEKYVQELERIMSVCFNEGRLSSIKLRLYFSLIMLELVDDMIAEDKNNAYGLDDSSELAEKNLRRIIIEDYINQYFNTPISINSLSKVLHLSTKQTERIVTQEMNSSFKNLVIKIRLETAMHYLKETNLSITEVAQKVGYRSYNGFYRVFLSHVGITPQDYRKQNKK
ncbi:MAG: helix-turn-helix transcriptional regulator [Clostridia bacterium]|nr:helix-turn-helix transcriptional regulator [Clostridia bacterium]